MKTRHRITALVTLGLLALLPARAQLIINTAVTPQSGTFNYAYTVSNQTATDFSVVTLGGFFTSAATVQDLFSPDGYIAFFDSSLGLLSFVEGSQAFAAGSVSAAFTFTSAYGPGAGSYEAIDINGDLSFGTTLVASVPPIAGSAVPEPSTTAAIAALFLVGLVMSRKFFTPKSPVTS